MKIKISRTFFGSLLLLLAVALAFGIVVALSKCRMPRDAAPPPVPKEIKQVKAKAVVPPVQKTNTITWRYPASIVPSNYWWNVERKCGVCGVWQVVITNATGSPTVTAVPPICFWRLVGRTNP